MSNGYKVGYKKPPIETRFKKGTSGCPDGGAEIKRRKKKERELRAARRTIGNIVLDLCNEPTQVRFNGKAVKMPKIEVMLRKLIDQAATGDLQAFKEVKDLLTRTDQLKPPAGNDNQRTGVLVVTPIRSEEDWERATAGHRLPKNPLHGIPGAEGMLSDEPQPHRGPPEEPESE